MIVNSGNLQENDFKHKKGHSVDHNNYLIEKVRTSPTS